MPLTEGKYRSAHFVVRLDSVVRPPEVILSPLYLAVHSIAPKVGSCD